MALTLQQDDIIILKSLGEERPCRVIRPRVLSDGMQAWMVEHAAAGLLNNRQVLTVTEEAIEKVVSRSAVRDDRAEDAVGEGPPLEEE